jgi:hypothetical protein
MGNYSTLSAHRGYMFFKNANGRIPSRCVENIMDISLVAWFGTCALSLCGVLVVEFGICTSFITLNFSTYAYLAFGPLTCIFSQSITEFLF